VRMKEFMKVTGSIVARALKVSTAILKSIRVTVLTHS